MEVARIKDIYQYNYALHRRVWESIDQITGEQFTQEIDYSIGSIRNHMVHLADVDERWMTRLKENPMPDRLEYEDFPTRQSIRAKWDEVERYVLDYVDSLTDEVLEQTLEFDMPHRGGIKTNTYWQILVHVANHGTDHRAQVLRLLHEFGAPTFDQDYAIYLWDNF